EKPDKAQDNGYHLFKYLRENYPEKEVYYVIDENSPDIDKVKQLGNVVFFQSPSHYILMTQAKYICTTHHPEHIFPSRNPYYLRRVKGLRVFLQHGVLGLKNLQKINGKQLTHFNIDLFVTSSDREKQIVNRDLLFDNNQIAVTGLPRFDRLFNEEQNVRDQILLIPTWRDWLPSQEALRKSEYLERINELLNSDILKKYSLQGTKIIFCLHPNMKQFINEFDIPEYIKAIRQDDVDVQTLIKESKLMITDYSSVGF